MKVIAAVVGGITVLGGFIAGGQSSLGGLFAMVGVLSGVAIGVAVYVLGVLVSAQGQILKATLDTAVNTSPLLSHDKMRDIMSVG